MTDRLRRLGRHLWQQAFPHLRWGWDWILLQLRMRLQYVAALVAVSAVLFPWLGWNTTGISLIVFHQDLKTELLSQPISASVAVDPVILAGILILGAYTVGRNYLPPYSPRASEKR